MQRSAAELCAIANAEMFAEQMKMKPLTSSYVGGSYDLHVVDHKPYNNICLQFSPTQQTGPFIAPPLSLCGTKPTDLIS